jgi:hypothetical protein
MLVLLPAAVRPRATRSDSAQPPSLSHNPQAWNDGSGRFHAAERSIDDVNFIRELIDADKESGWEKFERHFGSINLGFSTDLDNESIDSDLANGYLNTLSERELLQNRTLIQRNELLKRVII